ncbi:hypothetical protein B0T16DRAFT_492002 [Cercophora newfieldiana]|uniref:Uncharacterized protein n=1 Tax=Cercophora newfieldiana TaxID=92897 RepID=A0AA40CST2_9PEZI|nr:hypothetical protein B0T16DRAFT_492002 [Cercophora newfieldiana]
MRPRFAPWCLLAPMCASLVHASPDVNATPAPVATYPTTRTRVRSTTSTSTNVVLWINPRVEIYTTILTVTALEPGPVAPAATPVTVPQVAITSGTIRTVISSSGAAVAETPAAQSWVYTSTSTWLVSRPEGTFLPEGCRVSGEM